MAAGSSSTPCRLTPDPDDPSRFNAAAGTVNLKLVSKVGNIAFFIQNTDVVESGGASVNPTKTPTTLSFSVKAGKTYIIEATYFIFPTNSSGVLQEDCAEGVVLSIVNAIHNPQQFTIQG